MIDLANPEVGLAVQVVREAAQLAQEVQQERVTSVLAKQDQSPVTVADFAVQALLGHWLDQVLPQDPLVAEETSDPLRSPKADTTLQQVTQWVARMVPGATPEKVCQWIDHGQSRPSSRFWTLDPIDGTKGFLRGDQYAVALALLIEGKVQIGVLGCPNLDGGILVVAVRQQGSWRAPLSSPEKFEQLQVSECKDPRQARVLRSFEPTHTNVSQMDGLMQALEVEAEPVRMDSQAKYALLAEGKGDLLFRLLSPRQPHYQESIWDQAAGSLVVEEAGGQITDLEGKPLDFSTGRTLSKNRGVLSSNGHLHGAALTALASISHTPSTASVE